MNKAAATQEGDVKEVEAKEETNEDGSSITVGRMDPTILMLAQTAKIRLKVMLIMRHSWTIKEENDIGRQNLVLTQETKIYHFTLILSKMIN